MLRKDSKRTELESIKELNDKIHDVDKRIHYATSIYTRRDLLKYRKKVKKENQEIKGVAIMDWRIEKRLNEKYGLKNLGSYEKLLKIMKVKNEFIQTTENIDEYNELSMFEIELMKEYINTMETLKKNNLY